MYISDLLICFEKYQFFVPSVVVMAFSTSRCRFMTYRLGFAILLFTFGTVVLRALLVCLYLFVTFRENRPLFLKISNER